MILIVTGGIGSGKSRVCRILTSQYSCSLYEADSKAKELYSKYPALLEAIEKALGGCFRDETGRFVPQAMAERIFADPKAITVVEELLFPYLMTDFLEFMKTSENIVIFESATILEKPYFDGFGDKVILVDAPYEMRLERACSRDGSSKEAVVARMQRQGLMNAFSDGTVSDYPADSRYGRARERVDEIIMNDSSVHELEMAVKSAMDRLLAEKLNND